MISRCDLLRVRLPDAPGPTSDSVTSAEFFSAAVGERPRETAFLTVRLDDDLVSTDKKREDFDGEDERGEVGDEEGEVEPEEDGLSTEAAEGDVRPDPGRVVVFVKEDGVDEGDGEVEVVDDGVGGEGERFRAGRLAERPTRDNRRPPGC